MRERSLQSRIEKLTEEESGQPECWWWLSFADESGFRGACIVRGRGAISAIRMSHALGINPGGEVRVVKLPEDWVVDVSDVNRLLSKEFIEARRL